ncbi:MAG TPA: NUDIX domain-containing protein [Candidatus Marinimicrobia bacterium]|nr:NUDIX domain-containing protein [Candidatus Neomarinimicrobiota bacterium]
MTSIQVRVIDCWVFHRLEKELRFLIMKRNDGLQYEGLFHCVHGKIEADEAAWQTALRELREETGLSAKAMWVADYSSQFYEASSDTFNLVPVFACEVESIDIKLSREHSQFEWLTVSEAKRRLAWQNHIQAIEQISRMFTQDFPQKKWLEVSFE